MAFEPYKQMVVDSDCSDLVLTNSFSGAHAYYLRGQGYLQNYHDEENVEAAVSLFEQALRVDPDYARSEPYKAFWARLNQGEFQAAEFLREFLDVVRS